ncbi:MAG: hypothetical protein LAP61_05745 [Acidobacteriia bacterium]|nr:hypothetical protein [Terriglobia bacterium]
MGDPVEIGERGSAIDLSRIIRQIQRRYPDSHRSEGAHRALLQLWGGGDCNENGAFNDDETVEFRLGKERQWHATVRIATSRKGWHAVGVDYHSATSGGMSGPSLWNRVAYMDKQEAIDAGVVRLITEYQRIRDWPVETESNKRKAERMIALLEKRLGIPDRPAAQPEVEQLSLFGP